MPRMIEVEIDSVRVSHDQSTADCHTKRKRGRTIPANFGSVSMKLKRSQSPCRVFRLPRPQTHDLLKTLIQTLNGQLIQVEITSLSDDVFYGNLVLEKRRHPQAGGLSPLRCPGSGRPHQSAHATFPKNVMEQAGIMPEEDISELDSDEQNESLRFSSADEDLDIFENFLQTIDLNDNDETDDTDDDDLTQSGDED